MSDAESQAPEHDRGHPGFFGEVWRSIFPRPIVPRTDRERRKAILDFFVLQLRPVRVRRSKRFSTYNCVK